MQIFTSDVMNDKEKRAFDISVSIFIRTPTIKQTKSKRIRLKLVHFLCIWQLVCFWRMTFDKQRTIFDNELYLKIIIFNMK